MKQIAAVCLIVGVLSTGAWTAETSVSMPSLWRYAHPEARALVGIEWSRFLKSPMGRQLRQKMSESASRDSKALEIFDKIQQVFISSPGKLTRNAAEQPPMVVAVQGEFDPDMIRKLVADKTTGVSTYRSVEILEGNKKGNRSMALALIDPQTLLVGDLDSVEAAIDHQFEADPGQATDPLFLRAAKLAAHNDLWLVTDASPSDFSSNTAKRPEFLNDINGIEAGVSFQDGLGLQLNLGTTSDESAAKLAAGLQLITGMMLSSRNNKPGMPNLMEKLKVSVDGSAVNLAMRLDQKELEQSLGEFGKSMLPGFVQASAGDLQIRPKVGSDGDWDWGPPRQRAAAEPPRKQVIRIYGLEEGTREIPYSR